MHLDPIGATALPAEPPAPARRGPCADCPALLRTPGPFATTARCAERGSRLIAWLWNGSDSAPFWCPRAVRS